MVLAPIEFMDGIDELNKVIKSCGDDMTMQVKQAIELMASQFMGSRIFHHEETLKTIYFEYLNDWLKEFMKNNSNKNSLRNNHQCTSREETKELQIFVVGEEEKALHQEDRKSLPNDFEKYEETSHEKEEEYLETIEYHVETNSTMDMDQILLWVSYSMIPNILVVSLAYNHLFH